LESQGSKGIEKMVEKAKQMIREGRVKRLDRFTYQVVGDHGTYIVIKGTDGAYHCGCQGFTTRGFCSHALAVYLIEKKRVKKPEEKEEMEELPAETQKEEELGPKDILQFLEDEW
jgi:hypothetical protein